MSAKEHAKRCLDFIRQEMSRCKESEASTLEIFIDEIGSEVDGWQDRLREVKEDDED